MKATFSSNIERFYDTTGEWFGVWLHVEDELPVRMQVGRTYAEEVWKANWRIDAVMIAAFLKHRNEHVEAALRAPVVPWRNFRIYTIGETPTGRR